MIVALIALAAMVLIMHYPIYVLFMICKKQAQKCEILEKKVDTYYKLIDYKLKKLESEVKENE